MITLEEPHMGLNDSRTPNEVQMWNTWNVTQTETVQHMLDWVAEVARGAPGGKLKNLVFRCHGAPAYLHCGAGIRRTDTPRFSAWRGLIEKIWFSACQVGYITPHNGRGCAPGPAQGDGNMFCSEIAQAAQCHVVASTELQVIGLDRTLPYGKLDTFEGLVLSYNPAGQVSWRHRYPSTYEVETGRWVRNPD
ncbi:hypothetical protein [Inquilinus sp. CAU 1745]|uniref:hypothetical protein n=1 Tax=Inquilinus sp. CAU 1745 TaxID=3140369 RepID=UPI00325BBCD2